MAKLKVSREQMEALATQMNEGVVTGDGTTVKVEPAIDFGKKISDTKLRKALEGELPEVQGDDKFTDENWATINLLNGVEPAAVEEPATEEKTDEAPVEEPEPEKEEKPEKKAPAKKVEKTTEKAADKSAKKGIRYTRSEALADALKAGPGTKKEIVDRSDALFVKNADGKPNQVVSEAMYRYGVPLLKLLGFAEENDGVVELVVK